MNNFWINWYWWRTEGCYIFRSCSRCLKPRLTNYGICKKCTTKPINKTDNLT